MPLKSAVGAEPHSFVSDRWREREPAATVVVVPELFRALLELMPSLGK